MTADAVLRVKVGFVPLSTSQLLLSSSSSSAANAGVGVNTVALEQADYHNGDDDTNGNGNDDNDDGSNTIIANILVSHSTEKSHFFLWVAFMCCLIRGVT